MAQIDDELAIRTGLAELTAGQPAPPPGRYPAVRRRAVARRRAQLAGAAAAVAVLVAAAIAVPLGVLHVGPPPPTVPSRHYHVSEHPPAPGSKSGLVAAGRLDGRPWSMTVSQQGHGAQGQVCWYSDWHPGSGSSTACAEGLPTPASATGTPASVLGSEGSPAQLVVGTVRTDVTDVKIVYNNGQVLTAYPVAVFASRYARYFALPAPYSAAVSEVIAYSRTAELGYAIPFTADGNVGMQRWLRPGQPALPSPVTGVIGSGTIGGQSWHESVWVGPWGTCFAGAGNGSSCSGALGWMPLGRGPAGELGISAGNGNVYYLFGETQPSVRYLSIAWHLGGSSRVQPVSVGSRRFYAFASLPGNRAVGWTAYGAGGRKLGSGRFSG